MGWTSGTDTLSQLDFPSAEAAVVYAKRQGLNFIVQGPAEATQDCCPMTPWTLGFASDHIAAPNAWVSGIVVGAVATAALTKLAEWRYGSISYSGCGFWSRLGC
jgi:hypothetical protein